MAYLFDFLNSDGSVDRFDLGTFDSDERAKLAAGSALLVSTTALRVEVWRSAERIAAISRPTALIGRRQSRPASSDRGPQA